MLKKISSILLPSDIGRDHKNGFQERERESVTSSPSQWHASDKTIDHIEVDEPIRKEF